MIVVSLPILIQALASISKLFSWLLFLLLLNYIVSTFHVLVVMYLHEICYYLPNLVKERYSWPHRMLSVVVYFNKQDVFYIKYITFQHV